MITGSNPYQLQHISAPFVNIQKFSIFSPQPAKKGDQMYANFEGTIGPKMTTFSTAHLETQNLKADMLRSIYVVYRRFWRDRLVIFRLAFPAQKVSKNRGVKNCEFWTKFLGSRPDPTMFPGENPHMQKTLFWYCTNAQPLTLTPHKRKDLKLSLALHALGAENGSRGGPPSKFWLSGPGGPPGPCISLISSSAHTYSGP